MKKILMVFAAMVLMSGMASAASLFAYCSNFATGTSFATGGSVSYTDTCNGVSLPGGYLITSVEIWYDADWQAGLGTTGANTIDTEFTPSITFVPGTTGTPYTCIVTGNGGSS